MYNRFYMLFITFKLRNASSFWLLFISVGMILTFWGACKKEVGDQKLPVFKAFTSDELEMVTTNSATFFGDITDDGGTPILARGVCWSTNRQPTIIDDTTIDGKGSGKYTSHITGLTANTTYFLRAYATNNYGTSYGSEFKLITLPESGDTVIDIDGNIYHTVTIGSQVWLLENLKTNRYRNGDTIPYDTNGITAPGTIIGSRCTYNQDSANFRVYGNLYNWYAVMDSRKLAPIGWHVPSDEEWSILLSFVGGKGIAGGKLKETGTLHWYSPNYHASNEYGFTALPGGCRLTQQYNYYNLHGDGRWWTSTPNLEADANAWLVAMFFNDQNVDRTFNGKVFWLSVRCVRDKQF